MKEPRRNEGTKRIVFWYGQDRSEETREISVVGEDEIFSYYEGYSKVQNLDLDKDEALLLQKGIQEAVTDLDRAPIERLAWFFDTERKKKEELLKIPHEIREDFRNIGFINHHGLFLPIIQLSPFDVTGTVREAFLDEIKKVL